MEVTFTTEDGRKETFQGIERFHRMDPKDTNMPQGNIQPWALVEFEKRLRIAPWDWHVESVRSEGTIQ